MSKRSNNGNRSFTKLLLVLALVAAACTDAAETTTTSAEPEATTTVAEGEPEESTTTAEGEPEESTTTTEAPAGESDGILRVWSAQETELIFHPVQACCGQEKIHDLIFNELLGKDQDSITLRPELAVDWEASPDATEFTFTLADNVQWHDGTPFTAGDVAWTAAWTVANLETFGAFAPVWTAIEGADAVADGSAETLSGIEVIDDQTIRITLTEPNAEFLAKLTEPPNTIMPQHLLGDETADTIRQSEFATNSPVGTGPYRIVDVLPDQFVELEANGDYFKGAPTIPRVFWMLYGPEAALAALETGELELALQLDPREMERLNNVDGLTAESIQSAGIVRIELKNESAPFNDVLVRQAAYYGIDRREICAQVLEGLCTPLHVNPGFMQYEGLNDYSYDPDRARDFLSQSSYDGELVRIMWDSAVDAYNTIFPIIGQQMEEVGFNVKMQPTETNLWIDRLRFQRDTWEGYVNTGGTELLSPDRSAVYFNCAYEGERGKWQTGYENCEMDQLFIDARQTSEGDERDAIYQQIAETLNEDVPAIHLWAPHNVYAAVDALGGGFGIAPAEVDSFNDIETWTLSE